MTLVSRFVSLLMAVTVVGAALDASAQQKKGGKRPPMLIGIDEVVREPLQQTVPVIGRLVANRSGAVAARIAGAVASVRVKVGDRVKKGDVIAVLVKDVLTWRLNFAKAQETRADAALATKRAQRDLRQQELTRLERLRQSPAFSQARLEDKRLELAYAVSAIAEANASLLEFRANSKLAEINLFNADIRAPFGAVISAQHTEAGAYLQVGGPVVTLIDDGALEIEAEVPAGRIAGLPTGTEVRFRLGRGGSGANEGTLISTVRAAIPEENPRARTRTVRFTATLTKGAGLATNQTLTLDIPAGAARTVVSVHKDAVLSRSTGRTVFVIEGGKAMSRLVTLGEAVGTRFEVLEGLKPGDVVAVRGNERLQPGQPVRYPGMPKGQAPDIGKPGGQKPMADGQPAPDANPMAAPDDKGGAEAAEPKKKTPQ